MYSNNASFCPGLLINMKEELKLEIIHMVKVTNYAHSRYSLKVKISIDIIADPAWN